MNKKLLHISDLGMEWRLIHTTNKKDAKFHGEGLIEVRPLGSQSLDDWGGVCDNWITTKTLDLICLQLGFQKAYYTSTQSYQR